MYFSVELVFGEKKAIFSPYSSFQNLAAIVAYANQFVSDPEGTFSLTSGSESIRFGSGVYHTFSFRSLK